MNTKETYKAGQAGMLNSFMKFNLHWFMRGHITKDEFEQRFLLAAVAFQSAREFAKETPTKEIKAIARDLEDDCSTIVANIAFQFGNGQEYLARANEYLASIADMAGIPLEQFIQFVEENQ